jgi:hypothetical protein
MPPKESPSVTATERTWLTKRPYKRKKKANVPVPAPQAEAPAAAPAPVPLVAVDKAAASAPAEKKPPPVLPWHTTINLESAEAIMGMLERRRVGGRAHGETPFHRLGRQIE